jgi:hypothetical protein
MNIIQGESRSSKRDIGPEVIAVSGALPADNVTIAGTGHLEMMVEFIRRGFSHVQCRSADNGPHLPASPTDILIAPDVKSEADLTAVLTRLGRDLRPRGLFVISCAQAGSSIDERRLRRLLLAGGFTAVERIAGHGGAGTLWCAHKAAAPMRRAA